MLLNQNNFIRWYNATPGNKPLPRPYERESDFCAPAVVLAPGETYWSYINADLPYASPLAVTLERTGYSSPLTFTTYPMVIGGGSGTHRLLQFALPGTVPPTGTYTLKWSSSAGTLTSDPVEVITNATELDTFTAYCEFLHNKALGNFLYPYAEVAYPGFKQRLRLRLALRSSAPFAQVDAYRATTNGQTRNLSGTSDERIVMETPEYNTLDHKAAALMSQHDTLIINGISYIRNGELPYNPGEDPSSPHTNGEFGLIEQNTTILITT